MDGSRAKRLQELLRRLGQAVHGAVVDSDEVQACLKELHRQGWEAVMLLEASVACRRAGQVVPEGSAMHVHADPQPDEVRYRINLHDAAFLSSLGISPTSHRSTNPPAARREDDQPHR